MTTRMSCRKWRRTKVASAVALVVVLNGCGLEEIEVPDLDGPSEMSLSVRLTANPDIITADGVSTSLVQATVRDHNARPVAGRDIFFAIADESGRPADIGTLRASGSVGVGTGVVVKTNAQGIAQVIYEAPARTDATANQLIRVTARPLGDDAQAALNRSVSIELRSAEPRLFPQVPGNLSPTCNFAVETLGGSCSAPPSACTIRPNSQVLFQSTSSDPDGTIVRYWWDFGNGRRADSPDAATSYRLPSTYTVTHVVTDDDGAQAACQATLTVR